MNWGVLITTFGTAGVEFLETAAIAYAISRSGFRREAIWGTITGLGSVGIASLIFGTSLARIPLRWLQVGIGLLLIWFGWGWVKKSVMRQATGKRASWIEDPLTGEGIQLDPSHVGFSRLNFIVMVKSAALETLEVALVVITLGLAAGVWLEPLLGAGLALLLTVGLVLILHGHLLKIPEVLIKLAAGVMLMAYGSFWLVEGLGVEWPQGDWDLLLLVGIYSLISLVWIRWMESHLLEG